MKVKTPTGEVEARYLDLGDSVVDHEGKTTQITAVDRAIILKPQLERPIKILAGSVGEQQPNEDLYVSSHQRLFYRKNLPHAIRLFRKQKIAEMEYLRDYPKPIVYYHFALESGGHLVVNNLPIQSWTDKA